MIKNKEEVLTKLIHLIHDFQMLQSGNWEPDDDSCEASIRSLKKIIKYLQEHLDEQN